MKYVQNAMIYRIMSFTLISMFLFAPTIVQTTSAAPLTQLQQTGESIYIDAKDSSWTDTGITLQPGDNVRISATGEMSYPSPSGCTPDGECIGGVKILRGVFGDTSTIPISDTPESEQLLIGSSYSGSLLSGRLYLGIGDSQHTDNSGGFNVTITVLKDDSGGPGDKGSEGCPSNSSATTNYGWTLIHREGSQNGNDVKVPIASVKMQTRFCVHNISGQIVDIADDHEDYERLQVWVLDDQELYWSVTAEDLKCNYNQGESRVVCDGTHNLSARFSGSANIGINFSGKIKDNLTLGFAVNGTVTMAPYTREYYTQVRFAGTRGPDSGAMYLSPGVIDTWEFVSSPNNGPLCPSDAPSC